MTRRLQFSLRTALLLVFVIALVAWPTASVLRSYLANRGLVAVSGTIVYKGQPLLTAITLVPVKAGRKPVKGVTNSRGGIEMETLVMPGDYIVVVTDAAPVPRLSPKYASAATSGLIVSIQAAGNNHFLFDLRD